jgi:hypothetical protein
MYCTQEQLDLIKEGSLETFNKVLEEMALKTVETTLRSIPVMIGKLLQVSAATQELVKAVYDSNPEFKNYKELVAITIQEVEGANAGLNFQQVVEKAVPIIKVKIAEYDRLVNTTVATPSVKDIQARLDNGAI